jgi:AcrR family transcriptional regulator
MLYDRDVTLLGTRKSTPRVRGIARRRLLLEAARSLLQTRELDEISLGDVAAHAGVPKGSAYHFYEDIKDLYAALLAVTEEELLAAHRMPITARVGAWQDVIRILIERGVRHYAKNAASRQLQIGPKTPPALKLRDRRNDQRLGGIYQEQLQAFFELPDIPDRSRVFFHAVEIADLMFGLSVLESGEITPAMSEEATRAAVAYLRIYLPEKLPRKRRTARVAAARS